MCKHQNRARCRMRANSGYKAIVVKSRIKCQADFALVFHTCFLGRLTLRASGLPRRNFATWRFPVIEHYNLAASPYMRGTAQLPGDSK